MDLEEHLFRREYGRLIAALTRIFGVHNLALAEDVVQDAFCRALEVWKVRGIPDNPSAWLMAAAKHRALDVVRRERTARTFAPEVARMLESEWTLAPAVAEAFDLPAIRDEQLRMMFSCCHPSLPEEVQVALVLNILCGFGAAEIAAAFLTSRAAIEKRIARGKKTLARSRRLFDLADPAFEGRLSAVLRALYLLFNEGYHGASAEAAIRADLCADALRLTMMLVDAPLTATPEALAAAALMHLSAARLPSRLDASGELSGLTDQDRSGWDAGLTARGLELLERASAGPRVTTYHVEAAIAAVHASAPSLDATNWTAIVELYDRLMTMAPSPVVALNRAVAVGRAEGPASGRAALLAIGDAERLRSYPFYAAAIGEFERQLEHFEAARQAFERAASLARNPQERRFFERRARDCSAEPR